MAACRRILTLRRRNQNVRAEAFEDGAASFIKTILPVCDNPERALAAESCDRRWRAA